ncbi:hypothetical protein PHYPSEUDO_002940 [Phytophthora pseudosyringae]|uniref:Transposase IS30-like HTH domain-containing protein n=1 Tax=Phytophthora pseudosyringae TaxID=221518 RepID=A0A8T1VTA8_9STRA|nr:hypothetical protein PHYPSEUDO_002940 [Phytophthora pseudosyringae]
MAKGAWISGEERERIVQMREDGVPVKDIAKQMQRSTNFIYRLLRKVNGDVPTKKKTATVSNTSATNNGNAAPAPAAGGNDTGERRDELLEGLSDSSAALLCAVESMEVSAYEPIPMPRSVKSCEQRQPQPQAQAQAQVCPEDVNASVAFSTEAGANSSVAKPQNSGEFWLLTDTTTSAGRPTDSSTSLATQSASSDGRNQQRSSLQLQPAKKQKVSASRAPTQTKSCSASISSSLLVNPHLPRPRTVTTNNSKVSTDGLGGFLKQIQDEIRRLESVAQSDLYDAQLLQMLVKFHAEMLLVQLQKTLAADESSKRARDQDAEGKETSRLLREKLGKEIALLNVQADRERLELEREQIRHKTTSMICRKTLLDANASPADVDQLFPHQ